MDEGAIQPGGTVADLIRERAHRRPHAPFLRFEDFVITYGAYLARCVRVAAMLSERLPRDGPRHVGVLMENRPEFVDLVGGAALAGAVLVGLNATRRGPELERDIAHTDCALVVTDDANASLLDGLDVPPRLVTGIGYEHALPDDPADDDRGVQSEDLFLLIFTSGTTGAPKAIKCSHRRMLGTGERIATLVGLTEDDRTYEAMPFFHANALMCGLMPTLLRGATMALAPRFSVRGFLPDVRRYGCTYFPYSGKPLSFLVAAPDHADDADNPLRIAYGNEGSWRTIERFERRYGCRVIDGFGPTEGAMGIVRRPNDPPGSVGRAPDHLKILRDDGTECPPAIFDAHRRVTNAADAVGEIVNTAGVGRFEGYYNNPEAEARRVRDGMYWSGDLGYVDAGRFLYFAGRTDDWIRVDGENFPPGPIEAIVERHPAVFACAAYGVPDVEAGDRVMIAVQPREGEALDADGLYRFLLAQQDVSPKWLPTYVLVAPELPRGVTGKITVRELRSRGFLGGGDVFWRPRGRDGFIPLAPADVERIRQAFAESGREHLLGV